MHIQAIIVAGGSGTRMGIDTPKQFLLLEEKPIILWTLEAFGKYSEDIELIIVINPALKQDLIKVLDFFTYKNKITIVDGGKTRFESVKNGIQKINPNAVVLVHDSVRCLVNKHLIKKCIDTTIQLGNAVPCIKPRDSVRLISQKQNQKIEREHLRLIQTPQTFLGDILIQAFKQDYEPSFTDEASVVEGLGIKINLIDGDESNIKITYIDDLIIAESLLQATK